MKRCCFAALLAVLLLLSACTTAPAEPPTQAPTEATTEAPTEAATEAPTEAVSDVSDVDALRAAFSEPTTYRLEMFMMNLAVNGFERVCTQEDAEDGSFHFLIEDHQWDHGTDTDTTGRIEYYYIIQDGGMTYYSRINDDPLGTGVMSDADIRSLYASKSLLYGAAGLLPDYLEDFEAGGTDAETGNPICTFRIPAKALLADPIMPVAQPFLQNAMYLLGMEDASILDDASIYCTVQLDAETGRPLLYTQDYREIKDLLFGNGALSGEFAFDSDFMDLRLTLGYDTRATTEVPPEFLNTES